MCEREGYGYMPYVANIRKPDVENIIIHEQLVIVQGKHDNEYYFAQFVTILNS